LIVEASGVSRPLAIADALEGPPLEDRLAIDGIFCLVDAENFQQLDFADTELALDQALGSDLVVLNKCDLVDEEGVRAVEATLRGPMPALRILHSRFADVPRGLLLDPEHTRAASSHDHHHDHDHGDAFMAWSWRSSVPLDLVAFRAAMRALPHDLLRAKGILAFADRPDERAVFQLVGKRKELKLEPATPPAESTLVAIARAGGLDPAALTALFDGCRAASS
jgi:G3E family GTPase